MMGGIEPPISYVNSTTLAAGYVLVSLVVISMVVAGEM